MSWITLGLQNGLHCVLLARALHKVLHCISRVVTYCRERLHHATHHRRVLGENAAVADAAKDTISRRRFKSQAAALTAETLYSVSFNSVPSALKRSSVGIVVEQMCRLGIQR